MGLLMGFRGHEKETFWSISYDIRTRGYFGWDHRRTLLMNAIVSSFDITLDIFSSLSKKMLLRKGRGRVLRQNK